MDVSKTLRELRQRAGLTQVMLAERLEVAQATISHVERGGTTTTDVLARWVEVCGGTLTVEVHDDSVEALAGGLDADDRAYLRQVAEALPRIPHGVAKAAVIAALRQMAGLKH
jgi:transcriptional regulator with XRE-family HTH domain